MPMYIKTIHKAVQGKYVERELLVAELVNIRDSLLKGERVILILEDLKLYLPILIYKYCSDNDILNIIDKINTLV